MTTKWGIWCVRSAESVFGAATAWATKDGVVELYEMVDAMDEARERNELCRTPNVRYEARRYIPSN